MRSGSTLTAELRLRARQVLTVGGQLVIQETDSHGRTCRAAGGQDREQTSFFLHAIPRQVIPSAKKPIIQCPQEASEVLSGLIESDDEDMIEAVQEALAMTEEPAGEGEDGEDDIFPE